MVGLPYSILYLSPVDPLLSVAETGPGSSAFFFHDLIEIFMLISGPLLPFERELYRMLSGHSLLGRLYEPLAATSLAAMSNRRAGSCPFSINGSGPEY